MKKESAYHVLAQVGVDLRRVNVSGVWHNLICPFAEWFHENGVDRNPSFGVSISEEGNTRSYYKCLSCHQHGTLALLPARLGKLRGDDPSTFQPLVAEAERMENSETAFVAKPIPTWEDEGEGKHKTAAKKQTQAQYGSAMLHPYLKTRGLTWKDAWRLGLRYDQVQQRILFPVYNNQLLLEGYNGRSVMPKHMLHKKNPKSRDYNGLDKRKLFMFNPHFYRRGKKEKLILTEGALDYARGQQAGELGTHGCMGTALTEEKVTYLRQLGRPLFFFFDNDKAGIDALYGAYNKVTYSREDRHLAWLHQLYKYCPLWVCKYPPKAIEEGRTDPGSLTPQEFRWGVKNATLFTGADPESSLDENSVPF